MNLRSYVNVVRYEKLRKANTFSDTGIGACQPVPLLPVSVEPDAEDHEDDPTGCPDACDECRLLHHIGDLLRKTDLVLRGHRVSVGI